MQVRNSVDCVTPTIGRTSDFLKDLMNTKRKSWKPDKQVYTQSEWIFRLHSYTTVCTEVGIASLIPSEHYNYQDKSCNKSQLGGLVSLASAGNQTPVCGVGDDGNSTTPPGRRDIVLRLFMWVVLNGRGLWHMWHMSAAWPLDMVRHFMLYRRTFSDHCKPCEHETGG